MRIAMVVIIQQILPAKTAMILNIFNRSSCFARTNNRAGASCVEKSMHRYVSAQTDKNIKRKQKI